MHIASLEASLEKVVEAGARVVVVSFGSPQVELRSNFANFGFVLLQFRNFLVPCHQGAAHWLKETDCKLDMFLDQVGSHII